MAINPQYINDDRGQDEVVSNQRIRAYVPGTAGVSSLGGAGSFGTLWMQGTGVVTTGTGATGTTMTAAQLGGGIFVFNSTAAAQTVTLDTAANIQAYMNANSGGIAIGDIIQCLVINGGATNSFTITAGSGGASDTNQPTITILANNSKTLTIRFTAVGASPTYVVYA
jgi:hypothetical protein